MRAFVLAFGLLVLSPSPALAFGDCGDATFVQSFDGRLTAPCEEVAHAQIKFGDRAVPLRVLRSVGSERVVDMNWLRTVQTLAKNAGAAIEQIGGLDVPEVSIFLADVTRDPAQGADTGRDHSPASGAGDEECKITVYKTGKRVPVKSFTFSSAHDLFHCIQRRTWAKKSLDMPARWWTEGTAEYFANLVEPATKLTNGFITEFDARSLDTSLVDMSHPAVVFFLWLGQERGAKGVRDFAAAMAERPGRDAQLAALRKALKDGDWLRFAEAYTDGRIKLPGGQWRVREPKQVLETVAVDGVQTPGPRPTLSTPGPYVLARRAIVFDGGRAYGLRFAGASGSPRTRLAPEKEAWSDPPSRVRACDGPARYRVVTTSVQGEARHTIYFSASPPLSKGACCLVGDWAPTPTALDQTARLKTDRGETVATATSGSGAACRYAGGSWRLRFDGDGRGRLEWKDFATSCNVGEAQAAGLTQRTDGVTMFSWEIPADNSTNGSAVVTYTGTTAFNHMAADVRGSDDPEGVVPLGLPETTSQTINQRCEGSKLTVDGIHGLNDGATHTRTSPPPADGL